HHHRIHSLNGLIRFDSYRTSTQLDASRENDDLNHPILTSTQLEPERLKDDLIHTRSAAA
ncbi:hypothetical protein, partial [Nocardia sp. JCM 34519]